METNLENSTVLDIKDLVCGYGEKPIISDFSMTLKKGDIVAITGTNGCGESTLLKAIYGLCKINSGYIYCNGQLLNEMTPEQVKGVGISYFMQKNAIFTQLSVKENIILSLNGGKKNKLDNEMDKITMFLPEIRNWLNKPAGLLSGGQRQLLSFAMLLSQESDIWLLDEPTAGLDKDKTENFIQTIKDVKRNNSSLSIIFVEHKIPVVEQLASHSINLKKI